MKKVAWGTVVGFAFAFTVGALVGELSGSDMAAILAMTIAGPLTASIATHIM